MTTPRETVEGVLALMEQRRADLERLEDANVAMKNILDSLGNDSDADMATLRAIDWGDQPPPPPPPPDGNVLAVSNGKELQQAERTAKAGDVVELGDGSYDRNAFGAARVTYRAANLGQAVVTVPGLTSGAGVVLQGVVFLRALRVAGQGALVRACTVRSQDDGTDVALTLDGDGSRAEFVEVTDFAHRGILLTGVSTEISRFWLHGQRKGAKSITDSTAGLMFGGTHPKDARSIKARASYGRIEDLQLHDYAEVKAHDCVADHLCLVGGDTPGDLYVRHGSRFQAIACYLDGGRLLLGDDDAVAVACVTTGKHGACLGFRRGDAFGPDVTKGKGKYPVARNCRAVQHQGEVNTAWANGTGPDWARKPVGTVLEGIPKSQVEGDGPASYVPAGATPLPSEPARMLTPAEVGPAAWRPAS